MKLLYCNSCMDVVALYPWANQLRFCHCKKSAGTYVDRLNAKYFGNAVPLGFANSSFDDALISRPAEGDGRRFTAFVIPLICPTIKTFERIPKNYQVDNDEKQNSGTED